MERKVLRRWQYGFKKVLRRWQYGCKFLGNARFQGRGENHIELNKDSGLVLRDVNIIHSLIIGREGLVLTLNCSFSLTWMMSLPFSKGFLYWGIPSPRTIFKSPVLITSPINSVNERRIKMKSIHLSQSE